MHFVAAVMTAPFHSDIQGQLVQRLDASFCTGLVEVTPSFLSEVDLFLKLPSSNLFPARLDLQGNSWFELRVSFSYYGYHPRLILKVDLFLKLPSSSLFTTRQKVIKIQFPSAKLVATQGYRTQSALHIQNPMH